MRSALILVLLATLAAYAGSLNSGWHLDDNHAIVQNDRIGDLAGALRGAVLSNRGIPDLSFTLNWLASGADPGPFRVVNILIHLANGLLLFLLVRLLAKGEPRGEAIAAATTALFLLHPLATNSVTYVVQRYTSFAAFFFLASVVLYVRGREGNRGAALLSVLAACAAARSKETALTLPLVLGALEWFRPAGKGPRRYARIVPHLLAVGLIPLTLVAGRLGLGESLAEAMGRGSRETPEIDRATYLFTQVHVVTTYVRLILAPYGLSLDHDYAFARATDPATVGKGLFLAGLLFVAVRSRKRSPLAALGIVWFFATLLVESSVFPIRDVIFEHRTYLPSAGLLLASVTAIARLVPGEKTFVAAVAIAAAALGGTTAARNRVWRDEITLWSDCVRKAPGKARPHANLAYAYLDRGEKAKALESMRGAIRLGDSFPEDLVTLAEIARDLGERKEAVEALRASLAARPDYGRARRNLALLLSESGDPRGALQEAEDAVRLEPHLSSGWVLLARLRLDAGDGVGALQAASEAEERGGEAAEIELVRARSLAVRDDVSGALAALARWSAAGGGGSPEDAARAIRAIQERGHPREAASGAALASSAFPRDARFPYFAGAILFDSGSLAEAVPWLQEALRRSPADSESRALLERALRSTE